MLRFVILEHHWNGVHWDFMLESEQVLLTWALAAEPNGSSLIPAHQSADHRKIYLDYEGNISGGRGHVRRWDFGTFTWRRRETGHVEIELLGNKLRGVAQVKEIEAEIWEFWVD